MKHFKLLSSALAASMLLTSLPAAVYAESFSETGDTSDITLESSADSKRTLLNDTEIAKDANKLEELEAKSSTSATAENEFEKELRTFLGDLNEVSDLDQLKEISTPSNPQTEDTRPGVDVPCSLILNTTVNGDTSNPVTSLSYKPGQSTYPIQFGGQLDLQEVWQHYLMFKWPYIGKQMLESLGKNPLHWLDRTKLRKAYETANQQFRAKSIVGDYKYQFTVNPDVVSVNEDILLNKDAWQTAFEQGSGSEAEYFFKYMRCSGVAYDKATGIVTVDFTIQFLNEDNPERKGVSVAVLEDHPSSRPNYIKAYSPAGALYITDANFKDGAVAVRGEAEFTGVIDLQPWMALIFPIRFKAEKQENGLTLIRPSKPSQGGSTGGNGSGTTAPANTVALYRLYNPNSGEHFYTQALVEKDHLAGIGWDYEGIGWYSPTSSNIPVYRLYNPNAGDHHYTKNKEEKDELSKIGWKYEGIGFYSLPDNQGVKVYREYNPNAKMAGAHNYTTNKVENDYLISIGWLDEGIGWWASAAGKPAK